MSIELDEQARLFSPAAVRASVLMLHRNHHLNQRRFNPETTVDLALQNDPAIRQAQLKATGAAQVGSLRRDLSLVILKSSVSAKQPNHNQALPLRHQIREKNHYEQNYETQSN